MKCVSVVVFDFPAAPEPPQNVAVTDVTESRVTLSWTMPEDNNAPILGYRISYYLPEFIGEDIIFIEEMVVNVNGLATQETVTLLHPFVNYTFTVIAFNEIGDSERSVAVSALTNEAGWLVGAWYYYNHIRLTWMVLKSVVQAFTVAYFFLPYSSNCTAKCAPTEQPRSRRDLADLGSGPVGISQRNDRCVRSYL